ncbi:MAG: hypothetical protein ACYDHN_11545 [Solirubrobacteraceae bacterium]
MQCGAGAPTGQGSSSWRSAATLIAATVVLALGAAAAAYAALSKEDHAAPTVTTTVAQATTPTVTTPVSPTTVPTTPNVKTVVPLVKPPKIPLTTTPTTSTPTKTTESKTTPAKTPPASTNTGGATDEASQPKAILLDTNAASTYNPYNYPESDFGDPSLTIDGDTTTGWSAIVEPATAPKMAEGVLIDLKTPHKLAYVKLVTPSVGITVQVYGSQSKTAPTSITDPAWTPISHLQVLAKKHVRIKLRDQKKSFTNVVLWVSKAPVVSVGTPEAPGHVSVNEIELFPAH